MRSLALLGVCAIIFVIPFEEMAIIPETETIAKSLGYVALALSLSAVLFCQRIRFPTLAFLPLTLWLAWTWLSVLWSVDVEMTLSRSLSFTLMFGLCWMTWEFGDSEKHIAWLFRAYLLGCCVSLGTMFLSFAPGAIGQFGEVARFTGGDLNQNDLAAILNIAVPFAAYLASRSARGSRVRVVYWAFVPAAAIGVLLTGSRMGILVLGGTLSLTGVSMLTKGLKPLIPFIAVVAVAAYLTPRFMAEGVLDRVAQGTEASSFRDRVELWRAGLDFWQRHPIEGAGAGAYKKAAELGGAKRPDVAHSTYVTVLVEGGLVGAVLMLSFWGLVFRAVWKLPKRDRLLWFTVLAAWGAVSLTISWEYNKTTWFVYGASMAFYTIPRPNLSQRLPSAVRQRQVLGL
jgi:O-antigen ligase